MTNPRGYDTTTSHLVPCMQVCVGSECKTCQEEQIPTHIGRRAETPDGLFITVDNEHNDDETEVGGAKSGKSGLARVYRKSKHRRQTVGSTMHMQVKSIYFDSVPSIVFGTHV